LRECESALKQQLGSQIEVRDSAY